jgi:hypothetical protein
MLTPVAPLFPMDVLQLSPQYEPWLSDSSVIVGVPVASHLELTDNLYCFSLPKGPHQWPQGFL